MFAPGKLFNKANSHLRPRQYGQPFKHNASSFQTQCQLQQTASSCLQYSPAKAPAIQIQGLVGGNHLSAAMSRNFEHILKVAYPNSCDLAFLPHNTLFVPNSTPFFAFRSPRKTLHFLVALLLRKYAFPLRPLRNQNTSSSFPTFIQNRDAASHMQVGHLLPTIHFSE